MTDLIVTLAGAAVGLVASGIFLISVFPQLFVSPRTVRGFPIFAILVVVVSWNPPYPAFAWGAAVGLAAGALVLIVTVARRVAGSSD